MTSFVSGLACPRFGRHLDHREAHNVCPCGSPLFVEYDLHAIAAAVGPDGLAGRPPSMWRYQELLPVEETGKVVSMGEGLTPVVPLRELGSRLGLNGLWVKDEGLNPTGTFKARGASCGVSRAREFGLTNVALATAGNAGGAWACYGAAAGIRVHVALAEDAPDAARLECRLFGADVTQVAGSIADAGRVMGGLISEHGWFDVSTLNEPYRIEGKKTLGLELAEQFDWRPPNAVIYPAGGGVGLIGMWRAFVQLRQMGWLQGDVPRLIVTQSEGCAPLVKAFLEGRDESEPWPDPATFAAGLRVPKAFGDFLVLRAVRDTEGTAIAVPDDLIAEMIGELGRAGISSSPEGAATLAAAARLRERGDLRERDRVVLINTGSGMKYPQAMKRAVSLAGGASSSVGAAGSYWPVGKTSPE